MTPAVSPADNAWNSSQVDLARASQACIQFYLAKNYVEWVSQKKISAELRTVLAQICQLYLLHGIYENIGRFLQVREADQSVDQPAGDPVFALLCSALLHSCS